MSSETFGSVGVHLGSDARIGCHSYPDNGPILFIYTGSVSVTVHVTRHKRVDERDVINARALAEAAGVYLAECERVYAKTHSQADGTVDGSAGPSDAAA